MSIKLLTTVLAVLLLSSCASLWPWGGPARTGNCLDDDSCENTNPFEEELIGGTWYCYGVNRDEWDCGREEDTTKIAAISDEEPRETAPVTRTAPAPASTAASTPAIEAEPNTRAEMTISDETISNGIHLETEIESSLAAALPPGELFAHADDSYAVQLIALQTIDEVLAYAEQHAITSPMYARIKSQGDDWYVLILDVFSDKSSADEAANEWYAEHSPESRPWVRPMGPLKRAVEKASDQ